MDRLPFSHSEMSNIQSKIFTMIAAQVDRQGDKSLSKMEFDIALFCRPHLQCLPRFIPLLKACTEWTVQTLVLKSSNSFCCSVLTQLARISAKGHIGVLMFFREKLYEDAFPKIENVKALWEISEELAVVKEEGGWGKVRCVGGRGEGPKMTWEEVYESFLKAIC